MQLSNYQRTEIRAGALIADAIHESTGGGSNQPVADLYDFLVQHGRHEVVTDPWRVDGAR